MRTILILAALLMQALPAHSQDIAESLEEIVVTSQRREQTLLSHAGNIERLDAGTIDAVEHQHIHELLGRVAGVWVARQSGQEYLTAIRSPVLTGAGSCGAFLFLEDGVPIRPAGFCNVNSLFEAGTEYAKSIEVIRGPGNALYGSNALHGTVNVLLPSFDDHRPQLSLETGSNDFYRVRANLPFSVESDWLAALVFADDGGFREDSGYEQTKFHAKKRWNTNSGQFVLGVSATTLDQETAGFIFGEDAYKDATLNRANLNPEAFRNASSFRIQGHWKRARDGFELDLRPYLRHSDMEFLQHFLPGQPLEENGHASGGMLATFAFDTDGRTTIVGMDVEWADHAPKASTTTMT
jgi:outer membrane cobalamin receptor